MDLPVSFQIRSSSPCRPVRVIASTEPKDVGIDRQRARNPDALALTARELVGPAIAVALEAHQLECPVDALALDVLAHLDALETERDVVTYAAPRHQIRGLKDHGDLPAGRVLAGMLDLHRAPEGGDQIGDHPQERGLAGARHADDGHELALLDGKVESIEDRDAAVEADGQVLRADHRCHSSILLWMRTKT
jgi:hypothetical protein